MTSLNRNNGEGKMVVLSPTLSEDPLAINQLEQIITNLLERVEKLEKAT